MNFDFVNCFCGKHWVKNTIALEKLLTYFLTFKKSLKHVWLLCHQSKTPTKSNTANVVTTLQLAVGKQPVICGINFETIFFRFILAAISWPTANL